MTRLATLSAAVVLGACATTGGNTAAQSSDGVCHADKAQYAVGQAYTVELGADVETASGARSMRVIRPGQAVTMDYRPDRLNVEMDAEDKIIRLSCG